MNLKWILIIYHNGIPLFGYDVENKKSLLDENTRMLEKMCGFYNVMIYCNHFLLDYPVTSILMGRLFWIMHNEIITHYNPREVIKYSVILVTEINKNHIELGSTVGITIADYEKVLLQFAREISLDFYSECAEEIQAFVLLNTTMFNRFKVYCDNKIESLVAQLTEALVKAE